MGSKNLDPMCFEISNLAQKCLMMKVNNIGSNQAIKENITLLKKNKSYYGNNSI